MQIHKHDYKDLSDLALVDLLNESDHAAFTEIYNRFFGVLYVFAFRRMNDEDDAREVIQELFAHIWIKREKLQLSGLLSAYLYSALRNRMLNFIKRDDTQKKYLHLLKDYVSHEENIMSDYLIREKQLAAIIEKEINALPKKMRSVFLMSREGNLSYSEISKQLDLNKQTVRSHAKHALKILRLKLDTFLSLNIFL